jgi:hypothetical protein
MTDPISQRLQFEMGIRFDLMPPAGCGWKKWVFDPFFGLTLPGQVLTNPRNQVPKIQHWVDGEDITEPGDQLKRWRWTSRAFWLRAGCRLLGVDIGFALAWRRKIDDA